LINSVFETKIDYSKVKTQVPVGPHNKTLQVNDLKGFIVLGYETPKSLGTVLT
jgi:hypothetical protein